MIKFRQIRPRHRMRGFSLIELMVALTVFAILSAIATNSYRRYSLRATRTEGRLALLAIQVAQEKFFLQNNTYAQDIATVTAAPPAGLGIGAINASGVTGGGNYTVSFSAVTPTTYTLQAVATGKQTADTAACLTFTIDQQGTRTPADSTGCWR